MCPYPILSPFSPLAFHSPLILHMTVARACYNKNAQAFEAHLLVQALPQETMIEQTTWGGISEGIVKVGLTEGYTQTLEPALGVTSFENSNRFGQMEGQV